MTFKIWGTEESARPSGTDRDAIAMLPNGGYVVTWRENTKIAFQLYDGNGLKVGATLFVPRVSGDQQYADVIAYGTDGRFAITWTETNPAGGRTLYSRTFSFDGSAQDSQTRLLGSAQTDNHQMSTDGTGGWATVYIESVNNSNTVRFVKTGTDGTPGEPVTVATAGSQADVTWLGGSKHVVTYNSDGRIHFTIMGNEGPGMVRGVGAGTAADVVALRNENGSLNDRFAVIVDLGTAGIEARVYDGFTGSQMGAAITIAGEKPGSFDCVGVTALKSGGFAIAYIAADAAAGDLGDVYVRVVDANGVAGPALKVNARASSDSFGAQKTPAISEMADGRLAVSWNDQTIGDGLTSTTIVDARTASISVVGTAHNDVYAPSEHAGDTLNGGEGIDTLTFKGTTTGGVALNLGTGSGSAGDAAGDTYIGFENVIGSKFNDTLTGGAGANRLDGGAGNDVLDGGADADIMIGGAGNDIYRVDNASDRTVETSSGGTVDVVSSSVSYTLASYVERLYASGSSAINLTGNTLANVIKGNAAANKIYGGAGNDQLYGGTGLGRDVFVFNTALNATTNKDKIVDWDYRYDTIHLENAVFKVLTKTGTLGSAYFKVSSKALDANDFVGYNKATGDLWYDSNGNKAGGQVVFANIGANKSIAYNDFVVI